jgi:outer membrane immunogenic protein
MLGAFMKRLALALLAAISLSVGYGQIALAADLPVKAPIYKGPHIAPIYDWNGFYVGGHLGWGWGHDDAEGFFRFTAGPFIAGQSSGKFPFDLDGFLGGGQIGFNYTAWPHIVVGIEADLSAANIKASISKTTVNGTAVQDSKLDWLATVRGRAGYAFNEWLVYATGGAAWVHAKVVNTQVATFLGGVPPGTTESVSETSMGWTIGGGVEVGIARNWTAKLDYLYLDFGNNTHALTIFNRVSVDHLTMNVVRLGLNYKF